MLATDINCDMGESTSLWPYDIKNDLALLPWISSMNLACGYHAGDPQTMWALTEAARGTGVAIGAHPSFPDRDHFGRTAMHLLPAEIYALVVYQVGALQAMLQVQGTRLHHVKPHGALYNMAAADDHIADALCQAVKDLDDQLILYGLSGSRLIAVAKNKGMHTASEVFADRTYQPDGSLTPRTHVQALIKQEQTALQQVLQMVQQSTVQALDGTVLNLAAETICIHSDGEHALAFAQKINHTLKQQGIEIKPV